MATKALPEERKPGELWPSEEQVDILPWDTLGYQGDREDEEAERAREMLDKTAREEGIDPDEYETWAKLGEALGMHFDPVVTLELGESVCHAVYELLMRQSAICEQSVTNRHQAPLARDLAQLFKLDSKAKDLSLRPQLVVKP